MAMTLKDILDPIPVEVFLTEVWGSRPCHSSRGDNRFASLLSWSELNGILERHRLDYPRLRLSKAGKDLPRSIFITEETTRRGQAAAKLNVEGLHTALGDGAMLVVNAIDEIVPSIDASARDMERAFGEPVHVNAYAGWKTHQGFSTHWDHHDVIVLQLHGEKDWRIFSPTREFPLYKDIEVDREAPAGEPLLSHRLKPGDMLYIPRGWWHDARPCGEPTLHLTYSVTKRTGIDYVEALTEELRRDPVFRQDLPRFASRESQDLHLSSMRARLIEAFDKRSFAQYFADCDLHAPLQNRPSLPWPSLARSAQSWTSGEFGVSLLSRRRIAKQLVNGELILLLGGKRLSFALEAESMFDLLAAQETVHAKLLIGAGHSAGLSKSTVLELIHELMRLGVVSISDASESMPFGNIK